MADALTKVVFEDVTVKLTAEHTSALSTSETITGTVATPPSKIV